MPLGSPDLYLTVSEPLPAAAEQIAAWLDGPTRGWPTQVEASLGDILSSLALWFELHHMSIAGLTAAGEQVKNTRVPPLLVFSGENPLRHTAGLLSPQGMAFFTRPPDAPVPSTEQPAWGEQFALYVRQFGPSEQPAQRLLTAVQDWAQAGKPNPERLRIRAVPPEAQVELGEGEIVLTRPGTHLLLRYMD